MGKDLGHLHGVYKHTCRRQVSLLFSLHRHRSLGICGRQRKRRACLSYSLFGYPCYDRLRRDDGKKEVGFITVATKSIGVLEHTDRHDPTAFIYRKGRAENEGDSFVRCILHIVVHGYNDGMEGGLLKVAYSFVQLCEACLVSLAG